MSTRSRAAAAHPRAGSMPSVRTPWRALIRASSSPAPQPTSSTRERAGSGSAAIASSIAASGSGLANATPRCVIAEIAARSNGDVAGPPDSMIAHGGHSGDARWLHPVVGELDRRRAHEVDPDAHAPRLSVTRSASSRSTAAAASRVHALAVRRVGREHLDRDVPRRRRARARSPRRPRARRRGACPRPRRRSPRTGVSTSFSHSIRSRPACSSAAPLAGRRCRAATPPPSRPRSPPSASRCGRGRRRRAPRPPPRSPSTRAGVARRPAHRMPGGDQLARERLAAPAAADDQHPRHDLLLGRVALAGAERRGARLELARWSRLTSSAISSSVRSGARGGGAARSAPRASARRRRSRSAPRPAASASASSRAARRPMPGYHWPEREDGEHHQHEADDHDHGEGVDPRQRSLRAHAHLRPSRLRAARRRRARRRRRRAGQGRRARRPPSRSRAKFLENILADLRHARLVRSQRGAEGGYWLAQPAEEITLADIIRAVEGPLASGPRRGARGRRVPGRRRAPAGHLDRRARERARRRRARHARRPRRRRAAADEIERLGRRPRGVDQALTLRRPAGAATRSSRRRARAPRPRRA